MDRGLGQVPPGRVGAVARTPRGQLVPTPAFPNTHGPGPARHQRAVSPGFSSRFSGKGSRKSRLHVGISGTPCEHLQRIWNCPSQL